MEAIAIDNLAQRLAESLGDIASELAEIRSELEMARDLFEAGRWTENGFGGSE